MTIAPKCHICYGLEFKTWTSYHFHYQDNHTEDTQYSENKAASIRTKAMAEPIKASQRSKGEIVSYVESHWEGVLITGYAGRGLYE